MKSENVTGRNSGNGDILRVEEDVTTVQELIGKQIFSVVNLGDNLDQQITVPFCRDLLSIAIGRAPAGCAWVIIMANMDILTVSALTDTACVIPAEEAVLDDAAKKRVLDQKVAMLSTDMPVFEAALKIYGMLS